MRMLLAMALSLVSLPATAEDTVVPFKLVGDHIVVQAKMNGRTGRFILDTGSGAASVVPSFAERAKLSPIGGDVHAAGAGAGETKVRIGETSHLEIGPLQFAPMMVMLLSTDPFAAAGQPLSGALGYDVFAKWSVTIDFEQETLTFADPKTYSPARHAILLPADLTRRVPMVNVTVTPIRGVAPMRAKLVLDTGTSSFPVLLSADFATRAKLDSVQPRRTLALGSGTGGLSTGDVLRVAEVQVGQLALHNPVIGVPADRTGFFASGIADGTIGQGLFRRGRLTIDYPHNRIVFEPGLRISEEWDYPDHCGWTLGKDSDGAWAVLFVGADTPASRAGIVKNDRIVMVGGHPTDDMDRDALRDICRGDGALTVAARRGAGNVTLTIQRRKLI